MNNIFYFKDGHQCFGEADNIHGGGDCIRKWVNYAYSATELWP